MKIFMLDATKGRIIQCRVLRSSQFLAIMQRMQNTLSYRHREISEADITFISKLIVDNPGSSRYA